MVLSKASVLAIDYGTRKVGFASTDSSGEFVFGRGVFFFKEKIKFFEKVLQLIREYKIIKIVFGLPLDISGKDTIQSRKIRACAEKLDNYLQSCSIDLPIDFHDESFTSFEAQNDLMKMNFSLKKTRQHEDELAAIKILKSYLR